MSAVDLYWLPLGAGGHFVRLNGRAYEALTARVERRPACDLYHSALQVKVAEGTFVIGQAPVRDLSGRQPGRSIGSWTSRRTKVLYFLKRGLLTAFPFSGLIRTL